MPSLASVTVAIVLVLAAAKTSTGAPPVIWAASASEPAKLRVTLVPGWAASNWVASVVKVSLSEEAAETTTVPVTGSPPRSRGRASGVPEAARGRPHAAGQGAQAAMAGAR